MNGAETQYDPSRHGPPGADAGYAPGLRGAVGSNTLNKAPTMLDELQHRLSDSIQTTQELAGRIREFIDSVSGAEPASPKAGNGQAEPPIAGRANVLLDQSRVLAQSLTYLREQVDRLSRI